MQGNVSNCYEETKNQAPTNLYETIKQAQSNLSEIAVKCELFKIIFYWPHRSNGEVHLDPVKTFLWKGGGKLPLVTREGKILALPRKGGGFCPDNAMIFFGFDKMFTHQPREKEKEKKW